MNENDLEKFAKIMSLLSELYSKSISQTLIEIYWINLREYSIETIQKAVSSYIKAINSCPPHEKDGKFMPMPADIIRYINQDTKLYALEAWSKVEYAIKNVGRYGCVAFDDPLIHQIILKMGGWKRLCSHTIYEMPAITHRFIENYIHFFKYKFKDNPTYLGGVGRLDKIIKIGKNENSQIVTVELENYDNESHTIETN